MNQKYFYQRFETLLSQRGILLIAYAVAFSLTYFSSEYQRHSQTFCGPSYIGHEKGVLAAGFPLAFICNDEGDYSGSRAIEGYDWATNFNPLFFLLNTVFYFLLVSPLLLWINSIHRLRRHRA